MALRWALVPCEKEEAALSPPLLRDPTAPNLAHALATVQHLGDLPCSLQGPDEPPCHKNGGGQCLIWGLNMPRAEQETQLLLETTDLA